MSLRENVWGIVNGYSQRVECELRLDEGEELGFVLRIRKQNLELQ